MHGRTSALRRLPSRESQAGLALPTVLFLGVVLFMLITAVAFRGLVGLNQSDRERKQTESLHIADGGIDKALYELVEDKGFTTATGGASDDVGPTSGSDEKAWALNKAAQKAAAGSSADNAVLQDIVKTNKGEWAVVKPADQAAVYAVGWVPSRANPTHTRVLRIEYDFPPFNAVNAILTGGNLQIGGSAKVLGGAGSVHTNGSFSYTGGGWNIAGSVTAAGTFPNSMPSQIGDKGASGGSKPVQEIPDADPSAMYGDSMYDLCPDGTIHLGPRSPGGNTTGTPCAGPLAPAGYTYGWTSSVGAGSGLTSPTTWNYQTSQCNNGVFYVHWGNVKIKGNPGKDLGTCNSQPWKLTLLVDAKRTPGQQCPNYAGDIDIQGTPNMAPYNGFDDSVTAGILMAAGRDFAMQGNAKGSTFVGTILVHEQFDLTGNMNLTGNLIANDLCHTAGSPIAQNTVNLGGSSQIVFNQAAELPLGKNIRITRWTEL